MAPQDQYQLPIWHGRFFYSIFFRHLKDFHCHCGTSRPPNRSWMIPQICASNGANALMNSNNNMGEATCSIPSGSNIGVAGSAALEYGENNEKECAKVALITSSSETMASTDIMLQQQPQLPATPGKEGIHSSVISNGDVTPTAPDLTAAKNIHLRNIAPRPSSTPLATPTAASKRQRVAVTTTRRRRSDQRGSKRRRTGRNNSMDDDDKEVEAGDSSSDGSSNEATPVTTQTKSGRQIHRPTAFCPTLPGAGSGSPTGPDASSSSQARKRRRVYRKGKEMNITCKHCERAHSSAGNAIVFCDDCNRPWHQFCHDPPIEKEVVTVKELEWFCKECQPPADAQPDEMPCPQQASTNNRIDTSNHLPTLPSEIKVGGAQFSLEQKRGYLSSLSHSHLVDILLDLCTSAPELPIFPDNLPDLPSSTLLQPTAQAPAIQTNAIDRSSLMPSGSTPSAPAIATQDSLTTPQSSAAGNPPLPPATTDPSAIPEQSSLTGRDDDELSDDDEYMYVEDHRLYPKAGNGFRLPPDSEDLDMLLEDPACTTFSHALHGPAKARLLGSGGLPISGAA
ncbi:PHD finger containing protein Phf1 [Histoplasma capsulatum H143]|uniref:PHD finger containing protein Phf1 n=1 Tax=Ajellomyces capsulatus (strain H143) TaxID=544712 RepID=C6HRQ8_AJECH|nr:PHD finger containing protein Phf1 [Histoplasma capsulatum H143]